MTVNIDPKQSFIVPKFWGGVVSMLLAIMIALMGYIFNTTVTSHTTTMARLQEESNTIKRQIKEIEYKKLSVIDVIQRLHPDVDVGLLYQSSQLKYYSVMRGTKNETD